MICRLFGDAVLDFLQQHGLFAHQFVLQPGAVPGIGDIGDRQQQSQRRAGDGFIGGAIIEHMSVENQAPDAIVGGFEVDFIGSDFGAAGDGGCQQRPQARQLPFAVAEREDRHAIDTVRRDTESLAKGGAGGEHVEAAIEHQQRRRRGRHHCHGQRQHDSRNRRNRGCWHCYRWSHVWPFQRPEDCKSQAIPGSFAAGRSPRIGSGLRQNSC